MDISHPMMKKVYSAILLISFLAGIIQPVVPMAEYHLQKGGLFELIKMNGEQINHSPENFCSHDELTLPDDWKTDHHEILIDTEFYPIPIKPDLLNKQTILPVIYKGYKCMNWSLDEIFLKRYTPPPRFFI
jgi:hypothetical protein